jgi:hypothetical protein
MEITCKQPAICAIRNLNLACAIATHHKHPDACRRAVIATNIALRLIEQEGTQVQEASKEANQEDQLGPQLIKLPFFDDFTYAVTNNSSSSSAAAVTRHPRSSVPPPPLPQNTLLHPPSPTL